MGYRKANTYRISILQTARGYNRKDTRMITLVITCYSKPTQEEIDAEVKTLRDQNYIIDSVTLTKPNPFGFDERTYSTYHITIKYHPVEE